MRYRTDARDLPGDPVTSCSTTRRSIATSRGTCLEGVFLTDLGQHEHAFRCFEEALGHNPNWVNLWNNKARVLRSMKRLVEALARQDKVLECYASQVTPWIGKGNILCDLGRTEEARHCYGQALRLDPAEPPHAARSAVLVPGKLEGGHGLGTNQG